MESDRQEERRWSTWFGYWRRSPVLTVATGCAVDSRLAARIVDDASGQPLAARVAATHPDGKPLEVDGRHEHVQYLGKRWCYVDGSFTLAVPACGSGDRDPEGSRDAAAVGDHRCRALGRHSREDVPAPPLGRTCTATDYLSGDVHAHLPSPKDAALQMRAEDVRVVNLLALSRLRLPRQLRLHGPARRGLRRRLRHLGEPGGPGMAGGTPDAAGPEAASSPAIPNPGGTLEYWTSNPHWDIGRAARAAREQGGFVSWSHFENLPGSYSPVGRRARPRRRHRAHDLGRSLAAPGALEPVERLRPAAGRVHGDAGRGPLLSVPERGLPAADRRRDGQGRRRHARWAATGRTSPRDTASATRAWIDGRQGRPGLRHERARCWSSRSTGTAPGETVELSGGRKVTARLQRTLDPALHDDRARVERASRWPGRSCRSRPIPRSTASTR